MNAFKISVPNSTNDTEPVQSKRSELQKRRNELRKMSLHAAGYIGNWLYGWIAGNFLCG